MRLGLQFLFCFFLFSLHLTLPYARTGGKFSPFAFAPSGHIFDETHFYSPGPRRFARYGILSHDTDVFENRHSPGIYPQAASIFIGTLAKWWGDFDRTWMFLHGFLPALLWLVCYLTFRSSFVAWVLVLLGFGPKFGLLLSQNALIEPPEVTRLPNPSLSVLVFFLAYVGLSNVFKEKPRRIVLILTGLIGGSLFEFYPHYAIAWFASLAIILGFACIMREWLVSKRTTAILVLSLVAATPALLRTARYQEQVRLSVIDRLSNFSHEISWVGAILFLLGIVGTWGTWKNRQPFWKIGFVLLAACGLCVNTQVITGIDLHYLMHFRIRIIQPLVLLAFAVLLFSKWPKVTPWLASLLICFTLFRQWAVSNLLYKNFDEQKSRFEVVQWVGENIKEPSVFSTTDLPLIALLPGGSGHWSFVPSSYRTRETEEEILRRYVLASKAAGRTFEETSASLKAGRLHAECPWTLPAYFLFERGEFGEPLTSLFQKLWNEQPLQNRKMDYIITARSHESDATRNLPVVFQNRDWNILSRTKNYTLSTNE